MQMNQQSESLEALVLDALRQVTDQQTGVDVVSGGQVYDVVVTDGAVRVLIDPNRVPKDAEEHLAETLTPLVESLPGVARAVVKPRPRSIAERQQLPGIAHVIAVHSGKGGVGKSTLAANLAVTLAQMGLKVGLLDADVYGPSAPTLFGISARAEANEAGDRIEPVVSNGVRLMSLGFLLPASQALIWRGSLVDQGLPQLFHDVDWGELDILLLDLPPGTSDVHLAVARQVQLDGVITVTAPGQVSVDDVRRGMEMFADLAVPCLGIVENMSGVVCDHCGGVGDLFGQGGGEELASVMGLKLLARIPFYPQLACASDQGQLLSGMSPEDPVVLAFSALAAGLTQRLNRVDGVSEPVGEIS